MAENHVHLSRTIGCQIVLGGEKLLSTSSTRICGGCKDYIAMRSKVSLNGRRRISGSRNTRQSHALKIAAVDADLVGEGSLLAI